MAQLLVFNALISSERTIDISLIRLHLRGHMASKQSTLLVHVWGWMLDILNRLNPQLKSDEYPGAEDGASDDMGWVAAISYQKIVSFRMRLRACINAKGRHLRVWSVK